MSAPRSLSARAIGRRGLVVWALLLALLALGLLAARLLPEPLAGVVPFGIAATQAGLVAVLFMRLGRADGLIWLAAACGLFWLAILFTLTLADTLSRLLNT